VCERVTKFIIDSISCDQFGFQKHKSTLQQLLLCFKDLCSSNNTTDTIYLDFTKDFDSVPHNELLFKLWSADITSNLWLWFKSYLTDHTQRVSTNNCLSDLLDNVKIGNLKRKNRDHKKVPKQDEDTGNMQILLHLRSLF